MQQRLQTIIAHAGIASRRKAEELIAHGNVQLNGKTVKEMGILADPDVDTIVVNGKKISGSEPLCYFLLNKQRGVVSTVSDPDGKRTVIDIFRKWWKKEHGEEEFPRVYPVGRLDEESEGVILLTNDGELANRLTHPRFEVQKTYHVLVAGSPTNTQLHELTQDMSFKEGIAMADSVKIVKHEEGNTWIAINIHQGMNHQVRRMCARVNLEVLRLIRVKLGSFELGRLQSGQIEEVKL
ncbi:pseudouridine synthase [Candidatus Cerribacteria bacterium 'Amazon FNV 2010 28 9']|uniref:Pseudouridine synthase n=1 Tax=Candidatus Cerribacteria bacterium 'Amazon FNV 2010 28 9' TaxID=2081795 RepID=A0A317JNS3_9BACT|nr:MAG: pseudouridine synthase [Candidatus Cerribacteria bacterium 'Amazon FNV 2010 28 9']